MKNVLPFLPQIQKNLNLILYPPTPCSMLSARIFCSTLQGIGVCLPHRGHFAQLKEGLIEALAIDIFAIAVPEHPSLGNWEGVGVAVSST